MAVSLVVSSSECEKSPAVWCCCRSRWGHAYRYRYLHGSDRLQVLSPGNRPVFFGAGLIEGSGNALWSLTKDTPVGLSQLQGSTLADFINQPFTLGSLEDGPFYFEMPEVFEAGAVIRDVVTTDGTIVSGAPNYFLTLLAGWTVPAE